MEDKFEKSIKSGKIQLWDMCILEVQRNDIVDIPLSYNEEDRVMKSAIDLFLSMNLKEDNYIIWKLRKNGLTYEQIGNIYGLKKNTICERIGRIEKSINDLVEQIGKQHILEDKVNQIIKGCVSVESI